MQAGLAGRMVLLLVKAQKDNDENNDSWPLPTQGRGAPVTVPDHTGPPLARPFQAPPDAVSSSVTVRNTTTTTANYVSIRIHLETFLDGFKRYSGT